MIGIRFVDASARRRRVKFEAVELRHHHVEDREVGLLGERELERLLPVAGLDHGVAGTLEAERDECQDVLVVVGGEDNRLLPRDGFGFGHAVTSLGFETVGAFGRPGSGSSTSNVLPAPTSLSTEIVPPCASTIDFTIGRPRPVPGAEVPVDAR
jgi:hypothetical protein